MVKNSFGEIKINKDVAGDRIDIVDAVIDAWTQAMTSETKIDAEQQADEWLAYMDTLGI